MLIFCTGPGLGYQMYTHETRLVMCGASPQVERTLMVRSVVGSITRVDPPSNHPVLHDWYTKDRMSYHICEMVHIKYPLLLIENSSPCSGCSGFPLSLSEWPFTICLTPYNRK